MAPSATYNSPSSLVEEVQLKFQHQGHDLAEHLSKGVAVANVGTQKPVKRRTTFSISPEHMQEAQRLYRQPVTIITDKKAFLGDLTADSQTRRDSAIDLGDDDKVLTPPPMGPDNDYTPHGIPDAKDYMDKVLTGKIRFSPVKKARVPLLNQKKLVAEKAAKMPADGVLVVKSSMDEAAGLALPQEIKT